MLILMHSLKREHCCWFATQGCHMTRFVSFICIKRWRLCFSRRLYNYYYAKICVTGYLFCNLFLVKLPNKSSGILTHIKHKKILKTFYFCYNIIYIKNLSVDSTHINFIVLWRNLHHSNAGQLGVVLKIAKILFLKFLKCYNEMF